MQSAINTATGIAATLGGMAQSATHWVGEQIAFNGAIAAIPVVGEVTGAGRLVAAVAEGAGAFLTESNHLRNAAAAGHDFASVGLTADAVVAEIAAKVEWQSATAATRGTLQIGENAVGYSLGVSKTPGEVIVNAWLK